MKHTYLVLPLLALILLGASCSKQTNTYSTSNSSGTTGTANENGPDLRIKHLGVNLEYFNESTGMAGDFKFTKGELQFDRLWMDYGFVIPGDQAATGQDKANPQPTFLLPLGTPVRSLVDGVVVNVPQLYSGDYSVQVGSSKDSQWLFETEHVKNPIVKVGDRVTAGQVVAEVSDWDSSHNSGLGMVEIGILHGGNPPEHVCPFQYLDSSIEKDLKEKISIFYESWEDYRGQNKLHNEDDMPVIGCLTLDPIEG